MLSIIALVVSFTALTCSLTSFWLVSAWATMTAVRSAATVVVVAVRTARTNSRLLISTTRSAAYPWTATASWVRISWRRRRTG